MNPFSDVNEISCHHKPDGEGGVWVSGTSAGTVAARAAPPPGAKNDRSPVLVL